MSEAHQSPIPLTQAPSNPPISSTSRPSLPSSRLSSPQWSIPSSPSEDVEHARIQAIASKVFTSNGDHFDVIDIYDRPEGRRVVRRSVETGARAHAQNQDHHQSQVQNQTQHHSNQPGQQQGQLQTDDPLCSTPEPGARARIISIAGAGTIGPLRISYETACRMWAHYRLELEFRDIICAFGSAPNAGRGGATHGFVRSYSGSDDGDDDDDDDDDKESEDEEDRNEDDDKDTRVCAYAVQYFEENGRGGWRQGQTGVYHRHLPAGLSTHHQPPSTTNTTNGSSQTSPRNGSSDQPPQQPPLPQPPQPSQPYDLYTLLHSSHNSHFAGTIRSLPVPSAASRALYNRLLKDPFVLHDMLIRTCMADWTWYLRAKGYAFEEATDLLFATYHPRTKPKTLDFERFRTLREAHDDALAAVAFCQGTIDVIGLLTRFKARIGERWGQGSQKDQRQKSEKGRCRNRRRQQDWHATLEAQMRGHATGLAALLQRTDNALGLLEYSLDLKTSYSSADTSAHMNALAAKSADDSAAIRIITILTLVYLPGSFISSVFGMNFFDNNFPSDGGGGGPAGAGAGDRNMGIASNFWIYIVLWLPLTMLTIALYWFFNHRRRNAAYALVPSYSEEDEERRARLKSREGAPTDVHVAPSPTTVRSERFFQSRPTGHGLWRRPSTGRLPF